MASVYPAGGGDLVMEWRLSFWLCEAQHQHHQHQHQHQSNDGLICINYFSIGRGVGRGQGTLLATQTQHPAPTISVNK